MSLRKTTLVAVLLSMPFITGQGCPFLTPAGPTYTKDDLSTVERTGLDGAVEAASALAQADSILQTMTDLPASGAPAPSFQFGSCPIVTGTSGATSGSFTLGIDFGVGCHPLGLSDVTCEGSASGTFVRAENSVDLTFNSIACNQDTLGGHTVITYDLAAPVITLTGRWDLTWVSGDDSITTSGGGVGSFNANTRTTTISNFAGEVIKASVGYSITMSDIQVSYASNTNLIPSAGLMTITGSTAREITIRFNSTSPSTGDVEVSIAGSAYFPANLFQF